eukprot:1622504-Rhodomonas_salina.1
MTQMSASLLPPNVRCLSAIGAGGGASGRMRARRGHQLPRFWLTAVATGITHHLSVLSFVFLLTFSPPPSPSSCQASGAGRSLSGTWTQRRKRVLAHVLAVQCPILTGTMHGSELVQNLKKEKLKREQELAAARYGICLRAVSAMPGDDSVWFDQRKKIAEASSGKVSGSILLHPHTLRQVWCRPNSCGYQAAQPESRPLADLVNSAYFSHCELAQFRTSSSKTVGKNPVLTLHIVAEFAVTTHS